MGQRDKLGPRGSLQPHVQGIYLEREILLTVPTPRNVYVKCHSFAVTGKARHPRIPKNLEVDNFC